MSESLVGAIDLGTNTALLLVARSHADSDFEIVEDHCLVPRLGEGLAQSGVLKPEAVARALLALQFFAGRLKALNVPSHKTRVVSTAVLRRARDAQAFVDLARERTGLILEIVSGEEEARLGEIAVAAEGATRETIVIDVGGGSSEVSCRALAWRCSLPIGAVVLSESKSAEQYREAADAAAATLPAGLARDRSVIVLGGSGINLACLARGFERFDHVRAEGAVVETSAARYWADRLGRTPLSERFAFPIERERALILPAGLSILTSVLERLEAKDFRVTGRGLRFGVARELLSDA